MGRTPALLAAAALAAGAVLWLLAEALAGGPDRGAAAPAELSAERAGGRDPATTTGPARVAEETGGRAREVLGGELGAAAPPEDEPVAVELHEGVSYARIQGRVREHGSLEPIPGARVLLRRSLRGLPDRGHGLFLTERMRADEQGFFESGAAFPAGLVHVSVREGSQALGLVRGHFEHLEDPARPRPLDVRVVYGPTYRIEIVPASDEVVGHLPPTGDWRARRVEVGADGERRIWPLLKLAPGEPPSIRYGAIDDDHDRRARARLELRSRDGLWAGAADLPPGLGSPAAPIRVAVAPTESALLVRVVDAGGDPLPRARVVLLSEGEVYVPPNLRDRVAFELTNSGEPRVSAGGSESLHRFGPLEPGRYELIALDGRHVPLRRRTGVTTGTRLEPDFVFPVDEPAEEEREGRIAGSIRAAEPGRPLEALLRLRPARGELLELWWHATPRGPFQQELGDVEGSPLGFAFKELPPGSYELTVLSLDGRSFPEQRLVARPGDPDLDVVVPSAPEWIELAFRAVDAATGEPIPTYEVHVAHAGLWPLHPRTYQHTRDCLLYTSPSPRDQRGSRMPSSA